MLRARLLTGRVLSLDELWRDHPAPIVLRDERVVLNALAAMVRVADSLRTLLATEEPAHLRVDATVTDGATAELNALLAEAGIERIES